VLCADRGVEYECQVSAKNAIDFGTPAVATIQTPEGGNIGFTTPTVAATAAAAAAAAAAATTLNFCLTGVMPQLLKVGLGAIISENL